VLFCWSMDDIVPPTAEYLLPSSGNIKPCAAKSAGAKKRDFPVARHLYRSSQTHCWRKADSNPRSYSYESSGSAPGSRSAINCAFQQRDRRATRPAIAVFQPGGNGRLSPPPCC